MFNRLQNRNTGYSESLFSHNPKIENSTLNSIDGATALQLDEKFEVNEHEENVAVNNINPDISEPKKNFDAGSNIPSGVSIESASYMENNETDSRIDNNGLDSISQENHVEYTPKLFSDESNSNNKEEHEESDDKYSERLFEQDPIEEDDFEIPAFLRKQKF